MPSEGCLVDPSFLVGRRVLHVVQKYSSGVGSAIAQYTRSLPEIEHHLLSGTPVDAEGDLADQADFAGTHRMTGHPLAKMRRIRAVVREIQPDVVHAHSSHGGAYARLALSRARHSLVYTPHCYAFERQDIPWPARSAYWVIEALLATNTSAFAACAPREAELSAFPTRSALRVVVPNIAPQTQAGPGTRHPGGTLIAGGGRLSPQKDPAFFLRAVTRLQTARPSLRAMWLGDGDPAERRRLQAGGVEVTGWLPRGQVLERLAEASLYLHSARWEGFPLMVAEAAALGVPTLVRRLPSFTDVPEGLTVGEDDFGAIIGCLDDGVIAKANVASWADHLQHNTMTEQRAALTRVYAAFCAALGTVSRSAP